MTKHTQETTVKGIVNLITGDIHSINKENFAILYWFGLRFEPRLQLDDSVASTDEKGGQWQHQGAGAAHALNPM